MGWLVVIMIIALGVGIYVGLGAPGFRGRQDRVITGGRGRRLPHRYVNWMRPDNPRRR